MFASTLTQIDKIIEIVSQYVDSHIQNGTENEGHIPPIIYKEHLENLSTTDNKNDYLISILNKYIYDDKQLLPLVFPYVDFEYAGYIFDMIELVEAFDEFKTISLKEVMSITMKINRQLIDEDLHTKYLLYRKSKNIYSLQEMNKMKEDIFKDVLHVFNKPVQAENLNCLYYNLDTLEFMQYMKDEDLNSYTSLSIILDNFLKPLIDDFPIRNKLKVKKITCLDSHVDMIFIGAENKKLVERFINDLPTIYKLFRQAEGNFNFGYEEHKQIVYKYIDYLVLDNSITEKSLTTKTEEQKISKI